MHITQWGEYGVHFTVYIASRHLKEGATVSAAEIAEVQKVSLAYAQQILLRLTKGGIITSIRGPHGGYHLSRAASKITLRDILLAAEGSTFELICENKPLGDDCCNDEVFCGLRGIWHGLQNQIENYLKSITLEQLCNSIVSEREPIQIGSSQINSRPMH